MKSSIGDCERSETNRQGRRLSAPDSGMIPVPDESFGIIAGPKINWPAPPALWSLGVREAHVWAVTLAQGAQRLAGWAKAFSPDELDRAARFHFDRDRRRFIAGRGLLRVILGRYVGRAPDQLKFDYSSRGKPGLAGCAGDEKLEFNLAHSDELMLLAITRGCAIGVDVEQLRLLADAEDIAERFFSVRESRGLKALPDAKKPAGFFHLWTRKEACLKATGQGIADSLAGCQASFSADEPAQSDSLLENSHAGRNWRLCELAPAAGFVAALAVAAPDARVKCWQWVE